MPWQNHNLIPNAQITKVVDDATNPNIRVTGVAASGYTLHLDHDAKGKDYGVGAGHTHDYHAEMSFTIKCTSGNITVHWFD